jgi:Uma2 family endonuclease
MVVAATPKLITSEELLAMPDDGVERWIINGELREKYPEIIEGRPMTVRNRFHSKTLANVCTDLTTWLRLQPPPRGDILGGEAGVRLRLEPEVIVGIDVVYISHEVLQQQTGATKLVDGIPVLAVEILSPSDTIDNIVEKIRTYLEFGVQLVWIVDPSYQTVTVYSRGAEPRLFNKNDELTAEPFLPGFRAPVARFFE